MKTRDRYRVLAVLLLPSLAVVSIFVMHDAVSLHLLPPVTPKLTKQSQPTAPLNRSLPMHLLTAAPDDPELIAEIRNNWITPPSNGSLQLTKPDIRHQSQIGQSEAVDDILGGKTNGVFVECGAGNGERLSNTLFFERYRNWTGLLIEPNPENFRSLTRRQRHAHSTNSCISPNSKPEILTMSDAVLNSALDGFANTDQILDELRRRHKYSGMVEVQCFPFQSLLMAAGVVNIDYFSLDVEGAEAAILSTVPWEEVNINILSVEYGVKDDQESARRKEAIKNIVLPHGYIVERDLELKDLIFVKKPSSDR